MPHLSVTDKWYKKKSTIKGKYFSWVAMGNKGKKYATAGKGAYSYAPQKRKGTFHAGYGMS